MSAPRPTIVCLTPVRNEAWILGRFLRCAERWADHIIMADQGSTDGSGEIAARHPKVRVIRNPGAIVEEGSRQELLLAAAREIPGPRLLLALDADEMLSANYAASPEWPALLAAPPGTQICLERGDVYPFCQDIGVFHSPWLFGFMDDDRPHQGRFIHSPRVPQDEHGPKLFLADIKVLHYQYTDWARMKAKHRLYEVIEALHDPRRGAISIYRQYHHMDVPNPCRVPIRHEWLDDYVRAGIDMTSTNVEGRYAFDADTLSHLEKHGARRFAKLSIWDTDWVALAELHGFAHPSHYADPRRKGEKRVHAWLAATQAKPLAFRSRLASKFLRTFFPGW